MALTNHTLRSGNLVERIHWGWYETPGGGPAETDLRP